jgi:Arm DNA-binding domain
MGYRFGGRQKKLSFGAYPEITLSDAREKRDAARRLIAHGTDPSAARREAKRAQAAARTFGEWADEWLERERAAKPPYDERTMAGKERYVGYLKTEFGSRLIPEIKRPDVIDYLKKFEQTGKLETRDRVRSVGEHICIYADIEGNDYNPFRNLKNIVVPTEMHSVVIMPLPDDVLAARPLDSGPSASRFAMIDGEIDPVETADIDGRGHEISRHI